jgi:lipoprotein-releasing system permease protein
MGYPLQLALRYMNSKKGAFISVGTAFAIVGVALGVAALATVISVTGGFQAQFREKVLGVNAHVLVLKYSTDFREYRDVMEKVKGVPGVVGVGPFIINPMMVSHGEKTATGVLLKGVDPDLMPQVLDLPRHIRKGSLQGLRRPGAAPPSRTFDKPLGRPSLPPIPVVPPPKPAGSGEPGPTGSLDLNERDDAGRPVALMRVIKESIEAAPAQRPAEEPEAEAEEGDEESDAPEIPAGAPRGSIQPKGGYRSALPDDDVLPPDVAPDPCSSPETVAKLPGIVVGSTLRNNLGLELGSCVQVTSPTIGFTYSQGAIRPPVAKQFRVIAIFEAGFDQYDSKLVYTDLYEAQGFYDQGDTVTGVEMKVADIDKARSISHVIQELLANGLYHTMDWEELNHGLFTALLLQKIAMSMVLALIIVVAAFTVIATLIMVVLDKKKEIAVLKAMGATDGAILRTFLYQGAIIGSVGTTLGLVLGLLVCKGLLVYAFPLDPKVYFISKLPVDVQPWGFVITGTAAILICLVATVLPALYAAWLRPAEGLRAQ